MVVDESTPGSFRPYDVSNAVPTCQFRPNPDIRIPFDEDLPIVRHTEQGPTVIGRHIPPPNWSQSTLFRAASAAGAVSRTTQGQLFVRVRTWVIEHVDGGRYAPRDFTMRAQLLVRLREKIKRVWQDVIGPDDHLGIHVVRPAPFADADGTRYLPILAEANRPGRCTIQPVLFAVREITALGVSPPEWCACLVPSVFSVADIHAACQPAGEPHQLLVPQGSHDQRWMGPRHTRTATVGLFVPVWWDDRLQRSEEDQDSTSLLQASALAIPPWPPSPFGMTVEEAASLMQRWCHNKPLMVEVWQTMNFCREVHPQMRDEMSPLLHINLLSRFPMHSGGRKFRRNIAELVPYLPTMARDMSDL